MYDFQQRWPVTPFQKGFMSMFCPPCFSMYAPLSNLISFFLAPSCCAGTGGPLRSFSSRNYGRPVFTSSFHLSRVLYVFHAVVFHSIMIFSVSHILHRVCLSMRCTITRSYFCRTRCRGYWCRGIEVYAIINSTNCFTLTPSQHAVPAVHG